jgi:putative oxidoreductase
VQRLFPGFPPGLPGSGLLLLRGILGLYLATSGFELLASGVRHNAQFLTVVGGFWIAVAALIAIGAFTPIVQVAAALSIGARLALDPAIDAGTGRALLLMGGMFAITVAISLAMMGPGAYSLDAYLFGRKQIHIPPLPPGPATESEPTSCATSSVVPIPPPKA